MEPGGAFGGRPLPSPPSQAAIPSAANTKPDISSANRIFVNLTFPSSTPMRQFAKYLPISATNVPVRYGMLPYTGGRFHDSRMHEKRRTIGYQHIMPESP
jgi:hypothetical protein